MAIWISKLMNALCRPLVKRVSGELRLHHDQQFATLRRSLEPAVLPLVLKSEIQHMQQLPLIFLKEQKSLVFVGFGGYELSKPFNDARCIVPPVREESQLTGDCLVFLDEHHFLSMIRTLHTLLIPVRRIIMLPLQGSCMEEAELRRILHQLGFPEIFLMDYERISDSYVISGISHPVPVTALPMMIRPPNELKGETRWLVASRYPAHA